MYEWKYGAGRKAITFGSLILYMEDFSAFMIKQRGDDSYVIGIHKNTGLEIEILRGSMEYCVKLINGIKESHEKV